VKGQTIQLDWEADGAEYCTASGLWSGRVDVSGSRAVKAKKTGTYSLQCFDEDGVASKKLDTKATVVASKKKLKRKKLAKPTPTISAPVVAVADEEITLSWSTPKGTVACRAGGPDGWEGLKSPNGSEEVSVELRKDYTLVCWNENGEKGEKTPHLFNQKPNRYTAGDVDLSSDYLPLWPDDFELANGEDVYFIDFVKKEEGNSDTEEDDVFYFGARAVIDPETNMRMADPKVLRQLYALPGQVPPDVDANTKRIASAEPVSYWTYTDSVDGSVYENYKYARDDLNRFINDGEYSNQGAIPTLSPDRLGALAVDATLDYLELPKEDIYRKFYTPSSPRIWFNGAVAGTPMYAVIDVYNPEMEKILRAVLDPYSGEDVTDKGIFAEGGNVWDRYVLEPRDAVSAPQKKSEEPMKGQPVGNPPTQTPVAPITPPSEQKKEEQKKEEPKKEETKPVSQCQKGWTYSPTLGVCFEDTPPADTVEKPSCSLGYTYSITFKQCFRD
jgi:hypothetical protein